MMKFLGVYLAVLLGLSMSGASHATTKADATRIYNKLVALSGVGRPLLVFSSDQNINAYSSSDSVIVTQGMLNITNNAELALVIGHELGHIAHGDPYSSKSAEYAADKYGAQLISKAGYNVCYAARLFIKLGYPEGKTHPSDISRYRRLGC